MRRQTATLAVLLCLAPTPASHASAKTPPDTARWAATWLASRIGPGGYVAGADGKADPGTTVVAALALAAAGVAPTTVNAASNYLSKHIDDYARYQGTDRPGALGRLALLAAATGRDPNAFGGTQPQHKLVDRILATRTTTGVYAGLLADPLYNGTFSHALGLLGVAAARSLTPDQQQARDQALDFLAGQQCDGGSWQNPPRPAILGVALIACGSGTSGPDTNAAAFAVQAMAAHHRNPRLDPLAWFEQAQNAAGGFGYYPGGATDADSTALAVQAIVASGASPTAARFTKGGRSAYAALLGLQIGCSGAAKDRGGFAYMRSGNGSLRPNTYATAEAVPAAARAAFPIRRVTATVRRAPMPCARR